MEIVLAIATILGGITAVWFFWEKLASKNNAKHQESEDSLAEVSARLRSIQSPLLPCGLFCTLRHSLDDNYINQIFEKKEGDGLELIGMPVPPLPPGTADARVHFQNGYVDYRNGSPKEGGIHRLKHPGYNTIHEPISHRFATVASGSISKVNTGFFKPTSISIEFFFDGKPKTDKSKPSLVINSGPSTEIKVTALNILDNVSYSDLAVTGFTSNSTRDIEWSIQDIRNSYFRVKLEYFFIQGINDIPDHIWPRLHNLQIWLGPEASKALCFQIEELEEQVVQENPSPVVSGQARQVQICFEHEIDEEFYSNHILNSA